MGETQKTKRPVTLFFALLGTLALAATAGCSTNKPPAKPTPTSSEKAILNSAVDAYGRYSAAFDTVRSVLPAEADETGLRASVTDDYWSLLATELESDTREWRQRGSSAFAQEILVESSVSATRTQAVITVCVDLTHTSLIDQSGNTISTPDRRLLFPMTVTVQGPNVDSLLVADAVSMETTTSCGK